MTASSETVDDHSPNSPSGPTPGQWSENSDHSTGFGPLGRLRETSRRARFASLAALLVATGVLYVWDLSASGYANDFYAAAVQAGTKSWKALFFGSFDSSNFITVDKPPAALWPMEISGRIFGFNSWSMLVPQAIEGVLTVWLLYATVRRWFGHWAGISAGALLAITPVAALMFRFNNPDALMTLLIVLAAYCVTRAIENASTKWITLAGLVIGFSFLAKGLQPFTVLPALAAAYLVAAPTSWKRRIGQLLLAGVGIVVGAGWWLLAVALTPTSDRPYIGGSGDNTPLGLAFGYNGLSRLSGGSGPGGGGGGGFDGATGLGRMFSSLNGGQIAWLLPTALVAIVALVVVTRRAPLTDRTRAAVIVWGGWLLVTAGVLSFAGGIIHTYYTVELAPAIAALVAIGATVFWRLREQPAARVALAVGVLVSGIWGYALLHRTPSFYAWLGYLLIVGAIAVAALLLARPGVLRRGVLVATAAAGVVVVGGGSAAYAVNTASTAHTGSTPTAGPATSGGVGGFPGGGRGGFPGGTRGGSFPGRGELPGGGARGGSGSGTGGGFPGGTGTGGTTERGTFPGGGTAGTRGGGRGGGFGGGRANAAVTALLKKTNTTWAAATIGSQSAGPLELASGKAVMAIGGFSGSDPAPTLAQFETYVREHKIAYFIGGGGMGGGGFGPGGRGGSSSISTWVEAHYTAKTVGGETVYDLTKAKS